MLTGNLSLPRVSCTAEFSAPHRSPIFTWCHQFTTGGYVTEVKKQITNVKLVAYCCRTLFPNAKLATTIVKIVSLCRSPIVRLYDKLNTPHYLQLLKHLMDNQYF